MKLPIKIVKRSDYNDMIHTIDQLYYELGELQEDRLEQKIKESKKDRVRLIE